jgi:hypothetical protein
VIYRFNWFRFRIPRNKVPQLSNAPASSPASPLALHPMHSPCISVDSLLSACEYPAPIHSTGPHPNTSMMRACWTLACIPRLLAAYGSGPATSAYGSCKPCAVRPRRLAAHFFPHTRPPDPHPHFLPQHTAHTTFTHTLAVGAACLVYQRLW